MFENKKIFITGGTGSIGNAICQYFNKNKCSEIYASTTNLAKVKEDDSFISYKQLNLNDISKINLEEELDIDVDYLVLNAGVTKDNIFLRMSAEEWSNVIDVNLNSSFYLLKHFIKKMVKKRFGRIVFISSVVAHTGNPGQVNYTSSKAAISGMVKSNVKEDFKKFHDLEVNELDGLAIMADTDNSKMKSIAYFQNIYFSAD